MIDIECKPEGRRKITLVITGDEDVTVQLLIKTLAHFTAHLCGEYGVSLEECKLHPKDKRTEIL